MTQEELITTFSKVALLKKVLLELVRDITKLEPTSDKQEKRKQDCIITAEIALNGLADFEMMLVNLRKVC